MVLVTGGQAGISLLSKEEIQERWMRKQRKEGWSRSGSVAVSHGCYQESIISFYLVVDCCPGPLKLLIREVKKKTKTTEMTTIEVPQTKVGFLWVVVSSVQTGG